MNIINGLILAAGFSSRMGSFKMGMDIGGISMIERTVLNMQYVCDKVIVVSGYKKEVIKDLLSGYENIEIVENENYERGMFSSVYAGLKMLDCDRAFIQPGDIPFVSADVHNALLADTEDILIPIYKGKKGHPVLINKPVIERILKEPEDSKLNELFRQYGYKTIEVFEDTIHFDIDDKGDYKRYLNEKCLNHDSKD